MKNPTLKRLSTLNPKSSGRNNSGKITVRHQGGREKRFLRHIDWKRNVAVSARVDSIEYDPNRTSSIALLVYSNGIKDYILAPHDLKVGDVVISSETAEIKVGNCLPMKNIPIGIEIHSLEINPGKGAQMVRSAGNSATVQSKEGANVVVKLPSGEIRVFKGTCKATIGSLSNPHHKEEILGKAGRKRHMGVRPTVRGVAQDPRSHPHGGGEGRSGIGMKSPKSPWGKRTLGKRTRDRKKFSNKVIIKRRNVK
jgi:large subunit ribosomal protein L2